MIKISCTYGYIAILLAISLLVLPSIALALTNVYRMDLTIQKDDTVKLKIFELLPSGSITKFPTTPTDYSLKMLSKNEEIFKTYLDVSFEAWPDQGPPIQLDEANLYLRLPYFENVEKIEIYHGEKLIFSHGITGFNWMEFLIKYWVYVLVVVLTITIFIVVKKYYL